MRASGSCPRVGGRRPLKFLETELSGAFVIEIEPARDERGFFARSFCEKEFALHGVASRFVQCNVSYNTATGTTRGMHWQAGDHAEAKVVRCTAGGIFDVIVDLREESATRHRYLTVELSAQNRRMLFVPAGFAHGFQTLSEGSEVFYQMSAPHVPGAARGFRWDDPQIGIPWPERPTLMSDRDRNLPLLADIE